MAPILSTHIFLCQDWVPVPNQGAQPPPAESCRHPCNLSLRDALLKPFWVEASGTHDAQIAPWWRPERRLQNSPGRSDQSYTTANRRNFNYQLARLRARSEHAIGVLKGRFLSLRELRVRLSGEDDFNNATSLVLSCCVIHNICCQLEAPLLESSDAVAADEAWVEPGSDARAVRSAVTDKVGTFMREAGIYRDILYIILRGREGRDAGMTHQQ